MTDLFDRLKKRMETDDREIVSVDSHDYPMCRFGAMVPDSMSEDGTWAAYAESGPAKGNIVWETEAVPIAIMFPGEVVIKQTLMDALIEDNQRLRDALEYYQETDNWPYATKGKCPGAVARNALAASDKALEELLCGPKDL